MSAHERKRETAPVAHLSGTGETASSSHHAESAHEIRIGKTVVPRGASAPGILAEVFTMSVGGETIELLPLKNWSQLDQFKWRARGILPGTPLGLEITWDHLKVGDQTVSPWDPDAIDKVEKAFNEWLALEAQKLALAQEKAQASAISTSTVQADDEVVHFEIDPSKAGQPLVKCLEGKEIVKVVALNLQGLNALIEQGLMRKPQSLKVGALHDWIELDGEVFRFKEGTNWTSQIEKALNERYVVTGEQGGTKDVAVSANPAAPTGFDIQFPAAPNGVVENRKRHLNEETIQLLQDPEKCRVLRKGLVIKLAPPDLVFKMKTAEGGEQPLEPGPDSTVVADSGDGQTKTLDLSQPVSLLNLGAPELSAIFNHPAVNRRARLAKIAGSQGLQR